MTPEEINRVVLQNLARAEVTWKKHGDELAKAAARRLDEAAAPPSFVPGHEEVTESEVGQFVALVLDIRKSTDHLLQARNPPPQQLERVYYETSALLPTADSVVLDHGGRVTEYLGDGVLGLFDADDVETACSKSYNAAHEIMTVVRPEVNRQLEIRHGLPELIIGIGLAFSKALVERVGSFGQPRVMGECVYRASKLSDGHNEVVIDEGMKLNWPTSPDGKLKFQRRPSRRDKTLHGFVVFDPRVL
ncbi:MAG: adenylate/guanylate cyclase [Myxococcota bacterium]